ncbi:phage terminase small subunit P27 family [Mesorhizobium sp. M0771]|uniref:phage terminase small subunit P27 family n=1 Tax=Mesorhizobium sp. M0771 TaxID=2956997 RepID=UPI00333AE744
MRGRKPAGIVAGTSTVTKAPPPPAWLSKDAKAEWRRVAHILVNERKVLTEADLGTLESYCIATGTVREAHRALNRDGLVVAGKRHPAFGMMNAAQTTARLCAAELGLTPVSRSRPSIRDDGENDNDNDNPLDIS